MHQATTKKETSPVLAPVDFSAAAAESLLLAAQQADCLSRPLVVLHVAHDTAGRSSIYRRRNKQEQILPIAAIAEIMLRDFLDGMRAQHPDSPELAKAKMIVVSGLPATRILEVAHQIEAGLIVMAGKGRSNLSKLLGGSVSEEVARQSPVPVTIIHANGTVVECGSNNMRRAGEADPSSARVGLG